MIRISFNRGFWKITWHEGSSRVQTIKSGSLSFEWLQLSCHQKAAVFLWALLLLHARAAAVLRFQDWRHSRETQFQQNRDMFFFFFSGSPSRLKPTLEHPAFILFKLWVHVFYWQSWVLFRLTLMFWNCLSVWVLAEPSNLYLYHSPSSNSKWNYNSICYCDNQIPVGRYY